jgi:5-methylcytosine-specific restriction enzyme A
MPSRPLRPCKHRGCPALVPGGGTYCEAHKAEEVKWKPDRERGNRHARGYDTTWTKTRARIMRRDCGICQPCKRAGRAAEAREVDHIVSKANGGTEDDANLQAICTPCHKAKTATERR